MLMTAMAAALTLLSFPDSPLSLDSLALYLLIYLFTVQVKELSAQVRHYTQGIWSYINPLSNEAEMAVYPPLSLLPLSGVIPLIKNGLVLSVCVCVLDYRSWFWDGGVKGRQGNQGEAGSV